MLYFSPVPVLFLTYYLLFSGKKASRRNENYKGRQAVSGINGLKPNCPSNFHLVDGNCVRCPRGQFSFQGWIACLQWLDCANIALDVRIRRRIGVPGHLNAVKEVYLADWNGYDVVYSKCASDVFYEDCLHGMRMVEGLQGSEFVVQLIGICYGGNLELVTGYYKYGSAEKVNKLLDSQDLNEFNTVETRFQLCVDYVRILNFLHNSPLGVRVMCDSNDITKTLSQYLITDDFHLVVNDLDALPEVKVDKGELIKCGHRELFGDFVAPEQLWPFGKSRPFNDKEMPPYDERIDIWRIPNVVDKLLGRVQNSNYVRRLLLGIHESCKQEDPDGRPTAKEVLEMFLNVQQKIVQHGVKGEL